MCAGNYGPRRAVPGDDWERRMAEADERARAEDERERRIEQTPVPLERGYGLAVHADERETSAGRHQRHIEALEAVLRRWVPGPTLTVTDAWLRALAEELLAAAETGI